MHAKGYLLFFLFWGVCFAAMGQRDTLALSPIIIESYRYLAKSYYQRLAPDSIYLRAFRNLSITELLQAQGGYAIRTYGSNSLATLNLRGSASVQNNIVWNGVSLLSNMNGLSDLSLLPVYFFEQAQLELGSNSSFYGSGSIGGSLILNSQLGPYKGVKGEVGLRAGSFGQFQFSGGARWGGLKAGARIKMYHSQAENNFSFRNSSLAGAPWQRQTNARARLGAIMSENYFILSPKAVLSLYAWIQEANREIPPILSVSVSQARQKDETRRFLLSFKKESSQLANQVKIFYQYERIFFEDPRSWIVSDNKAHSLWLDIELRKKIKSKLENAGRPAVEIIAGGIGQYQKAQAQGYGDILPQQYRTSLWGGIQFFQLLAKNQSLDWILRARWENIDGQTNAPAAQLSAQYQFGPSIQITAQLARSFRFPTFNDLYWRPGGNPSLKPETGWNSELFFNWKKLYPKNVLKTTVGLFSNWVENWIIWLPQSNYWEPVNLQTVWARGAEWFAEVEHKINKNARLHGGLKYTYCKSSNQKERFKDDQALGKQLIYTPFHNAQAELTLQIKALVFRFYSTYTGSRYITSDNTQALPAFGLANALLAWNKNIHFFSIVKNIYIHYRISNLLNRSYFVIAERPMPGRQHEIHLQFSFH
jgi:iron complex outermembrane receptor protein